MAKLFIVRHGQASFGQANYDQLSELGWQQARWLGEYFAERELNFHRVVAGDLQRQQDTAKGVLEGMAHAGIDVSTHPGLNEYDGEMMYRAFTGQGTNTCTRSGISRITGAPSGRLTRPGSTTASLTSTRPGATSASVLKTRSATPARVRVGTMPCW